MNKLIFLLSMVPLALSMGGAFASDYPQAPHTLKDAESQGLVRVNANELKEILVKGTLDVKGEEGKRFITFSPDGTFERKGQKSGEVVTGKWNIDEGKNAYCMKYTYKGKYKQPCFAVFRAPDGVNFFDYDADAKFDAHVWRPATAQ
jgi:hypothetical protein